MEAQLNLYRTMMTLVLVFFLIFINTSFINTTEFTKTNEQLRAEMVEQREHYESLLKELEEENTALKADNIDLTKENDRLSTISLASRSSGVNKRYNFTSEEVNMLAQCVEAEAGINNYESQKYVAQVILNRLHSERYPNTLKEVIYQKSGKCPQFSVAYNGAMNREVTLETLKNVQSVLIHGTDIPDNVFFFYAESVTGNWVNTREIYKVVQGTVFAY